MASKKRDDAGWFYHAPSRRQETEQVHVPPPSQIPGLSYGDESAAPVDTPKMWIKDTDSPYIRLAKQGGRADLLRYRSPVPGKEGPQGYPRCEWYYHEDANTTQQTATQQDKGNYEFMLPDYMVHQECPGQSRTDPSRSNRAPFAYDENTVYSREDNNPTDKTVKLPELKQYGYGTRAEKLEGRKPKYAPIERPKPIRQDSELDKGKMKYKPVPTEEGGNVMMGKLLSHGYKEDWESRRDSWEASQQKQRERYNAQNHLPPEKYLTEYQEKMITSNCKALPPTGKKARSEQPQQQESKKAPNKLESYRNRQMHGLSPIVHDLDPVEPRVARQVPPVM